MSKDTRCILSLSLSLSLSFSLSLTHTHTLSHSLASSSHIYAHTHTYSPTHSHVHTHTHTPTRPLTHMYTHTHTHTLSHLPSHPTPDIPAQLDEITDDPTYLPIIGSGPASNPAASLPGPSNTELKPYVDNIILLYISLYTLCMCTLIFVVPVS